MNDQIVLTNDFSYTHMLIDCRNQGLVVVGWWIQGLVNRHSTRNFEIAWEDSDPVYHQGTLGDGTSIMHDMINGDWLDNAWRF